MIKRAIIAVSVLAIAAPGLALAKGKKAADTTEATAGPIPYSQLAEEDAKLNAPAPKHHAKRKAAAKADAAPAAADAGKTDK